MHTPGPWNLSLERFPSGKLAWRPFVHAPHMPEGERYIGELNGDSATMEANARLIASAPDLLAELETVADWLADLVEGARLEDTLEIQEAVLSVIARAKGGAS